MPGTRTKTAITAPQIFDGEQFLEGYSLILQDGTIEALVPATDIPATAALFACTHGTLAPGFIDLQVNGGGDTFFTTEPTLDTLARMCRAHRAFGTTSIMATVVSETRSVHERAVHAVLEAQSAGQAGILGIHLEGPFFNPSKRGAHRADRLRELTQDDLQWLQSLDQCPTLLTLAPETLAPAQLQQLAQTELILCAGHTNASFYDMEQAAAAGVQGVTHLFNAMSPLQSRAPGATGAALVIDNLWVGIIADGHHVHPAAIALALRAKPAGKLVLVSDAMATVGGQQSEFEIYGETIRCEGGKLVNAEGNLAGSAIGLMDAVRYCHQVVGAPLEECLRMASQYPASIMGQQDRLGQLRPGMRADLVHFDDSFTVLHTWLAGQLATHSH